MNPSHDDPRAAALGESLAVWLEELDLVPHLGAAGLPTLRRDDAGAAVWSDPKTGERLDRAQLEQLDRLLRSEGSDPRHAVPVPLLQLRRQAAVRVQLLESPWFTYSTLASVRGESVDATRFAVHKAHEQHRLLVVAGEGQVLVPAFQLDADGELRPDLAPVLEPLLAAQMDPWAAWDWLTRPVALLGGLVPQETCADPETADLALHAAVRLAERSSSGAPPHRERGSLG